MSMYQGQLSTSTAGDRFSAIFCWNVDGFQPGNSVFWLRRAPALMYCPACVVYTGFATGYIPLGTCW